MVDPSHRIRTLINRNIITLIRFATLPATVPGLQAETSGVAGTTPYQGTSKSFESDPTPKGEQGHLASIPVSKRKDCRQSDKPYCIDHTDTDTKRPTDCSASVKLSNEGKAAVEQAVNGGELPPKPAAGGFEGNSYSLPVDSGQI